MNGRKRRVIVDTLGLTLDAANVQDRDGAKLALGKPVGQFPGLRLIWADGGYAGKPVDWVNKEAGCALEIVKRPKDERGFKFLAKRWAVESTFAAGQASQDDQGLSETWIRPAMICLTLRRLAT